MEQAKPQRWQIGDVTITKFFEVPIGPVPVDFFYPDATPEMATRHEWLRPHHVTPEGMLHAMVPVFVIETPKQRILVDGGVGNDKERVLPMWNMMKSNFLDELAAAGYPADKIDIVLNSHLHVDHVGWYTRVVDGRWVPTFRNARYLFGRVEWEVWTRPGQAQITPDDALGDSVRPVVEAGQAEFVETDHRVSDEVWLSPLPGHSPGLCGIHVASKGREAILALDLMHHPLQLAEPDLRTHFCFDKDQARATRKAFLAKYEDKPVLIIGSHFAAPSAGYVVRDGAGWRLKQ